MNAERLYRHSMPGILFLAALFLFYLLLRQGDPTYVYNILKNENYLFFIAILITSPILGLLISTISHWLLDLVFGYTLYLNNPSDNIKWIVLRNDDPLNAIPKNKKFDKAQMRNFFCKYQVHVRKKINSETLRFLERRWNFFWIHYNNITAIIMSFIFCFFLECGSEINGIKKGLLISILGGLILYIIAASYRMSILIKEVTATEEEAILKNYFA